MGLPFTRGQLLRVFAEYNVAVWPGQLLLTASALLTLFFAARGRPHSGKVVNATLAALWLWMGAVYHLTFFAAINRAAYLFGAAFTLQALLFFSAGFGSRGLTFRLKADARGAVASILFTYSLIVYPALGHLLGREYPAAPTFGLPCPTTIYTFAVLLCARERVPIRLLIVPLAWSVVGSAAAVKLGVAEDFGLPAAGLTATALIAARNRKLRIGGEVTEATA